MSEEPEQSGMRVVDRRRFVLEDDGSVSEHPEALKEMHKGMNRKVDDTSATPSASQSTTAHPSPSQEGMYKEMEQRVADTSATPQTTSQADPEPPPQDGENDDTDNESSAQKEGVPFVHFLQQQAYLAMIYLGQQPNPSTGLVQAQPEGAREIVDVLLMLRSRTKGNLKREESLALNDLIHQLQLAYVQVTSAPPSGDLDLKNKA